MDKILHQNNKILPFLKGMLFSYIITTLMLLLLSLLMLKLELPSAVISGGINLAYIASCFVGGLFVGKKLQQKKFLWGLVMGALYFMVLLIVCLMMNSNTSLPLGSLLTVFIICGLSGMLGGMIS